MMPMIDHNKEITLDEAIAHFETIDACARIGGEPCPIHGQLAWYLRRLKRYEEAIEKGELAEVIHASWICTPYVTMSKRGREVRSVRVRCSHCGAQNGRRKDAFCQACGAKMDGERGERHE